jgi:hypothetical protein
MAPRSFSESELAEIVNYDGEVIEMTIAVAHSLSDSEHASTDHTDDMSSLVSIYDVSCNAGASSSIKLRITAFDWHGRLTYTAANGARIGISGIASLPGSYYPPQVLTARFEGVLPRGTREISAFWWYGSAPSERGPVYSTQIAHSC